MAASLVRVSHANGLAEKYLTPMRVTEACSILKNDARFGSGLLEGNVGGIQAGLAGDFYLEAGVVVTFQPILTAAVRRGPDADAGPSADVQMQDVDSGNQNYAGPSGSGGPSGGGGLRGNQLRESGDQEWSKQLTEDVQGVLKESFSSPTKTGMPKLKMTCPANSFPLAKERKFVVHYGSSPSLLLTDLPERGARGWSEAGKLLSGNEQLHDVKGGQHQAQSRLTSLIGPSGVGKTRTALEALCQEYGFYLTFSTEKDPGSRVLQEAVRRFNRKYAEKYDAVQDEPTRLNRLRETCLEDLVKLVARILLAMGLGLLKYLDQHRSVATPKGFLLFQLIGAAPNQEDWVLKTWEHLLDLSSKAVEAKLAKVVMQLRQETGQSFFNVMLDEAQVGTRTLADFFPSSNASQGRPLLNGLVRNMGHPIFERFHFNLTGTGISLKVANQLETAVSASGVGLRTFVDFKCFSVAAARGFTQGYLVKAPENLEWNLLVGRPRFAAKLVQQMLEEGCGWESALKDLKRLHTDPQSTDPTSLQRGLKQKKGLAIFPKLRDELKLLVGFYALIGKAVATPQDEIDMVEVGVCYLEQRGRGGKYTLVALLEPLVALAVCSFLESVDGWTLGQARDALLRTSIISPSTIGTVFELIIPRAQRRFLNSPCLAEHPLLHGIQGLEDLPSCFVGPSSIDILCGESARSPSSEELLPVQAFTGERGLIEWLCAPNGSPFFFPEPKAGPDVANFASLSGERWMSWVQAKCRKMVTNEAQAWGTLSIATMFSGEPDGDQKRAALEDVLQKQQVKGILQVLVAYPADLKSDSIVGASLRRSERLQNGREIETVQVCISRANARHYLTPEELACLDCLKGTLDLEEEWT